MIVAFSTSSPVVSLAVFGEAGELRFSGTRPAQGRASEGCLELLEESGTDPATVALWLADLGPGSFTGTRVGVVLAKTFAWTYGVGANGVSSFDLIAPGEIVALPNRKNEWLVRVPGEAPETIVAGTVDAIGYAPGLSDLRYPEARGFAPLLDGLEGMPPERLIPGYVVPPSISTPKRPLPGSTPP